MTHFIANSSGGVELLTSQGKIRLINTMESRLELLGSQVSRQGLQHYTVVAVDHLVH